MKTRITSQESLIEQRLKADLKKLLDAVVDARGQQYIKTLPYYKMKLGEIQANVKELLKDAKEKFATANRR